MARTRRWRSLDGGRLPTVWRPLAALGAAAALALSGLGAPASAAAAPRSNPAVDYQDPVSALPPVSRPNTRHCTVEVMRHDFGNNLTDPPYGTTVTPPTRCAGPWTKVVMDWSGSVKGRQYDRLAGVWLGGAEIFRTSTAEPDEDGINWHVDKDITEFAPLLRSPQQLEVELGNVVNSTYTGVYHMRLSFTYYLADARHPAARTADRVIPVARHDPKTAPWFELGKGQSATASVAFPTNLTRARLELYARGGGCDEQWFTAVPDDLARTAPDYLCGGGPYREVLVSVDGRPAGLAQPYPVVYSGGIVPTLWRPIPAIDQFRTEAYDINLTPFAGQLADGRPHSLTISPYAANDTWTVGGSLFVDTDHGRARTGGAVTADSLGAAPRVATAETKRADGGTDVAVDVHRDWSISGYVDTSHGRVATTVEQHLGYRNTDAVSMTGQRQVVHQRDTGSTTVRTAGPGGDQQTVRHSWAYPIDVDSDAVSNVDYNNYDLRAAVTQGRAETDAVRAGRGGWHTTADVNDRLTATGELARKNGAVLTADGTSTERYREFDDSGFCYDRELRAAHGWITSDTGGARARCSRP
ncbi:peptide-N4-asparagine amidase [Streptomyces sp. RPT161]|uniref:peptide-N4-asparagine amidase n=1 Tax=Streptomyces sp. RPT161 TaxID=3015993 RepID=UPI0022B901BB|nr:peptide-N4-asparagine amidase [Streptomyces sp. RPT161]